MAHNVIEVLLFVERNSIFLISSCNDIHCGLVVVIASFVRIRYADGRVSHVHADAVVQKLLVAFTTFLRIVSSHRKTLWELSSLVFQLTASPSRIKRDAPSLVLLFKLRQATLDFSLDLWRQRLVLRNDKVVVSISERFHQRLRQVLRHFDGFQYCGKFLLLFNLVHSGQSFRANRSLSIKRPPRFLPVANSTMPDTASHRPRPCFKLHYLPKNVAIILPNHW